jgi:hypothetical protein
VSFEKIAVKYVLVSNQSLDISDALFSYINCPNAGSRTKIHNPRLLSFDRDTVWPASGDEEYSVKYIEALQLLLPGIG